MVYGIGFTQLPLEALVLALNRVEISFAFCDL